ncbi:Gfo/Idh/MocA family oxidoreductase [Cognatishimia sp. WU-CL00825]|uniref:Gfo/Idh/MocA family protein n=1 Tax=Cognatishimia sp. WU-CL00825 TaxID=3127658 RepID=UPI003102499B
MHWGLIGASTIAAEHVVGAIRSQDGHSVNSVFSTSQARGEKYAADHGIDQAVTSLDAILSDASIQAVYISTTNEKHMPQALAAIAAGKHVMCEKPLAMTAADAITMVNAAKEAGVVLATNHHLRNAGSHLAIKDLIVKGVLGDILSIRINHAVLLPEHLRGWRLNDADAGGGVIPDIVVHDADTVRFHLDEDPIEVVAMESHGALSRGVEDSAMSIWRMPSGVQVLTHESFTHPFSPSGFEVHGTKGSAIARNVMTQQPVGEIMLHNGEGVQTVPYADHNLYARSFGLFAAAVRGEGQPAASGIDGVKSLAVAEAVKQAAVSGRVTSVDYRGV